MHKLFSKCEENICLIYHTIFVLSLGVSTIFSLVDKEIKLSSEIKLKNLIDKLTVVTKTRNHNHK